MNFFPSAVESKRAAMPASGGVVTKSSAAFPKSGVSPLKATGTEKTSLDCSSW